MSRARALLLGTTLVVLVAAVPVVQAAFSDTTTNAVNNFEAASVFPSLRITTYEVRVGAFGGTTYTMTLQQDLSSDYFIMMRGGAGQGGDGGDRGPDENFARVSGDPHGNFALTTSSNQIRLERRGTTGDWQGQVTVVESIRDPLNSSFELLDVVQTTMGGAVTSASSTSVPGWTELAKVGLYGGQYGGGVDSTHTATSGHPTGWAQISPSGSDEVILERQAGGPGSLGGTARFTTYVVQWGTEWTIQRVTVSGTNGGDGVDATNEYDTAGISSVSRANTFVLAYGRSADNGIGDGWEGAVFTLGDGVTQNATESVVAVGSEFTESRTATVYVHTHPDLRVDYRFGADGTTGIPEDSISGTMAVDTALESETYDTTGNIYGTGPRRLAILSNSSDGTGNEYPRPLVWARPSAAAQVTWTRSRHGEPGAFWLQSVDFALIGP